MKIRIFSRIFLFAVLFCMLSAVVYSKDKEEDERQDSARMIYVIVALCDNVNQGIVPVSARLGNGNEPGDNLYWGARYGVNTFLKNSAEWTLLMSIKNYEESVLERSLFKHESGNVYLVADAYRGREIKRAVTNFLRSAAGGFKQKMKVEIDGKDVVFRTGGEADLVAYVGHNGLMDFTLEEYPEKMDKENREAIVLACFSNSHFSIPLKKGGAKPLLLIKGLMAPEAYTLKAALDGWIANESGEDIRLRAVRAYDEYQKCGFNVAERLFATGLDKKKSSE